MTALRQRLAASFDNPVLRREIKLVTRRGRFEWVVFLLTVAVTLVIASVGGRAGAHPATVGQVLFQTFFGIAHGLVLLAGPAVAANSIASEREGRTYEALALTGLPPGRIARGKFLAAVANVGAYVVALAPVGALPFLFGGVSALAMVLAFGMLAVVTALAALVGLAISARLPTTRAALITSVVAGALLALFAHSVLGETVGNAVCTAAGTSRPGTIWLPVLLAEADLPPGQVLLLAGTPLVLSALLGWFLLEVCVANLSDPSADRTTGLKRWFAASTALGAVMACGLILAGNSLVDRAAAASLAVAVWTLFAVFVAFVFQGDAVIAPRRVRLLWAARGAGVVRRFFGPGATSSAALQLGASGAVIGTVMLVTVVCAAADEFRPPSAPLGVVVLAAPAAMFVLFVVGLGTWLRVRYGTGVGRAVLAIVLLVVCAAPFAVTSILDGGAGSPSGLLGLLAAPSPLFALETAQQVASDQASSEAVLAMLVCTGLYTAAGVVALASAMLRSDQLLRERDAETARMDALIAAEDAAAAGGAGVGAAAPVATPDAAPTVAPAARGSVGPRATTAHGTGAPGAVAAAAPVEDPPEALARAPGDRTTPPLGSGPPAGAWAPPRADGDGGER